MSKSTNIVSIMTRRELHAGSNRRECNREFQDATEDMAASCEMEEMSCRVPENTRSTFLFTFSPDGTKVASAHGNHKIYICDVNSGKCLHTLEGHPRTPWCIAFHPNFEDVLASGCLGGEVRVWNLNGGCEIWVGVKNSAISSLTFHPTDRVLVIATTNCIYFWDWSQSQPFASCKTSCEKERVRYVQFDSFGYRLFTGIANVTPVYRQRDFPVSFMADNGNMDSNRHSSILDTQQLRSHNQIFTASNTIEEVSSYGTESSISPSYYDGLRLAREYAAYESSRQQSSMSNNHTTINNENLLERVLSLRSSITLVSEQFQLMISENFEVNLANGVFRFWRQLKAIFILIRQLSPQFGFEVPQSYLEARRRHINYLFQLREMMHLSGLFNNSSSDQIIQRHKRDLYSIMSTLLELAFIDFNMLVRRTTRLDENDHGEIIETFAPTSSFTAYSGANERSRLELRNIGELISNSRAHDGANVLNFSGTSSFIQRERNTNNESNRELLPRLDNILEEILNLFSSDLNSSRLFHNNSQQNTQRNISSYANFGHPPRSYGTGVSEPVFVTKANYRVQCWNFTKFVIPDISDANLNIVVPECLIQNDASIEISTDEQLLATLVPSNSQTASILAIYSIKLSSFGQCLYLWNFISTVISISLSPLGRYVLVGLGSNRRSVDTNGGKLVIGQVLKLIDGREGTNECVQHVRTVELRGENRFDVSLNSMKWLPHPGSGLVYGTNRGDLRICRPKSFNESDVKSPSQWNNQYLAQLLPLRSWIRRPVHRNLYLPHNVIGNFSNDLPVDPSTSSAGTQI